jgi:aspartyl-tRNA(Asn)/glutamyl-tRNA(Gln) amidotransferase subunit A
MSISRRSFLAGAAATTVAGRAIDAGSATGAVLPHPAGIQATNPADLSLTECAAMLQAGRLSSVELTNACLDRSRARDGGTTAWRRVYPDYAIELAKAADARLAAARRGGRRAPLVAGVPLALKDLYAVKGFPVTASSNVLTGNIAIGDSTVWKKLRAAGMVLLGHSETDEFAIGVGTPQCGNPWDPTKSPGGSSGGSGALLGARLIPAATGTDTGGSLRLPATACGTTSLKPSFGRVSAYGVIPLQWSRDHAGPMGRAASDAAILLTYMAGPDQDDPSTLAAPPTPAGGYPTVPSKSSRPYAGKRFGVVTADASGLPAATAKIFARFLDEVQSLGGTLVDVALPAYPSSGTGESELAETGLYHQQFAPGSTGKYRLEWQAVIAAAIAAQQIGAGEYLAQQRDRVRFMHDYARLFAAHGLSAILVPGTTLDGATREELAGLTVLSGSVPGDVAWANYAGAPAICTPGGRSAATGMPFGIQIGVLPWQESEALQLALDHQAAYPYWRETPKPLQVPRSLPTAELVTPPARATTDPTGTDARHPALVMVPTLSTS